MRPIKSCLWFDTQAEEAARFYVSVFPDAAIGEVHRAPDAGPGAPGPVVSVSWRIGPIEFVGLNGAGQVRFTPAVSFVADCEDQAEVDRLWDALLAGGGTPSMCGWLEDRFGVSWQVIPRELYELIRHPDAAAAMLTMVKIDLAELRRAAGTG